MERQYTRQSPGCFHSMQKYLSELSGMPMTHDIRVNEFRNLYYKTKSKNPKKMWKLKYHSYDIKVVKKDGSTISFMQAGPTRFDHAYPDTEVDHFLVTVPHHSGDFGIPIHPAGSYKDCLGGGWTCTGPMLRVNDQFFAPEMECSCR